MDNTAVLLWVKKNYAWKDEDRNACLSMISADVAVLFLYFVCAENPVLWVEGKIMLICSISPPG